MYPTTILEWLHNGEWKQIGWVAFTPRSTTDLRQHAESLAAAQPHHQYRLARPSHLADHPPVVLHAYNTEVSA